MRSRLPLFVLSCLAATAFTAEPRLPGIGAAMEEMVARKEIAGAVTVVVAKDKLLHVESTGLADVAAQRAMTPETIFWIASMSKPVTAVAVLMLQRANFPNSDASDVRRAFQHAAAKALAQ